MYSLYLGSGRSEKKNIEMGYVLLTAYEFWEYAVTQLKDNEGGLFEIHPITISHGIHAQSS